MVATPMRGLPDLTASKSTEVELFSVAGRDGLLREVNEAFARLLGVFAADINGRSVLELVHPDDIGKVVEALSALDRGAKEVILDNRFLQSNGHTVYLQWVARPVPGTDLWWASGRDTTEFHRLLAERSDLRTQLELAVGQSVAAMWELDVAKGIFTWEAQAAQLLGVAADVVPTGPAGLAELARPEDGAGLLTALKLLGTSGSAEVGFRVGYDAKLRYLSLRGRVLDRDRRGRSLRAVGLILDVTSEKAMEEQMLRMVMSDALTGIPNRRAFDHSLRSEWRRCTRGGQSISVLMLDIDNFKAFNDNYGHLVGDTALCAVARVLAATVVHPGCMLARFGGEEFAVVMPATDLQAAKDLADQLVAAVRTVELRQAPGKTLTVSIGAANWQPGDPVLKAAQLLERADKALYVAKSAGKNQAVAYQNSGLIPRARS